MAHQCHQGQYSATVMATSTNMASKNVCGCLGRVLTPAAARSSGPGAGQLKLDQRRARRKLYERRPLGGWPFRGQVSRPCRKGSRAGSRTTSHACLTVSHVRPIVVRRSHSCHAGWWAEVPSPVRLRTMSWGTSTCPALAEGRRRWLVAGSAVTSEIPRRTDDAWRPKKNRR